MCLIKRLGSSTSMIKLGMEQVEHLQDTLNFIATSVLQNQNF